MGVRGGRGGGPGSQLCLDPGILGEVPVYATALLQPGSQLCLDPGILGVVPACATALLQPGSQLCLDRGILGEVPVCYSPATARLLAVPISRDPG